MPMNLSRRLFFSLPLAAVLAPMVFHPSANARKNAHGAQGTGNYKGKRDRHEKPGPDNERKKSRNWIRKWRR
jgi:hypothetical protein